MTAKTKVTKTQATQVLKAVATWLGTKGYGTAPGKPAPTGAEAALRGLGPQLVMDWDWPGSPTPAIILEGGPYDWAVACCAAVQAAVPGVYVEPYSGWALCVYPE